MTHGQGTALVDSEPAPLLEKIGASAGRGPALFAWSKVDDSIRRQLDRTAPGTASVQEMAAALDVAPAGADARLIGRCDTPEGAQKAADATRALIDRARRSTTVTLLGLGPMAEAIKVQSAESHVTVSLHLSSTQFGDLVTRLSGVVAAALQSQEPPAAEPAPASDSTHGGARRKKSAQ